MPAITCAPETTAGICRPRVRARMLVVGGSDRTSELAGATAERLRVRCDRHERIEDAARELAEGKVSCVVLDAVRPGFDPRAALARLSGARPDVPIVVVGEDPESPLAMAAVQAGAQDYLLSDGLDAALLERAVRYAMDRKRTEVQLSHLALHDQLTGLANRALFDDRLGHALARRREGDAKVAVLLVDIDGFKRINESLGHAAGDDALREAADRIRSAVRPHDTVARLGGDEFTVLCEDVRGVAGALAVARRVGDALARPLTIAGQEIFLRASIGLACAGPDAVRPAELLRRSDAAMYRAKARGGACPEVYAETPSREPASCSLALESALRRAIPGELVAHYQPVVALDSGRCVGVEALVRWHDPSRGLVPPAEFVPLAEESGLVVPLGDWMLREACRQATRWPGDLRVSVNVSGRQLVQGSLVASVAEALQASGLEPDRLQLELTETVLMDDVEASIAVMRELRELGVGLALDDFGKGYSSLSYLHRFPVTRIKIDRSFVRGLPGAASDVAIVSAVLTFGRALGLDVVAEGVETEDHARALRELGCRYAQGFHFHRPMAADELDRTLLR